MSPVAETVGMCGKCQQLILPGESYWKAPYEVNGETRWRIEHDTCPASLPPHLPTHDKGRPG